MISGTSVLCFPASIQPKSAIQTMTSDKLPCLGWLQILAWYVTKLAPEIPNFGVIGLSSWGKKGRHLSWSLVLKCIPHTVKTLHGGSVQYQCRILILIPLPILFKYIRSMYHRNVPIPASTRRGRREEIQCARQDVHRLKHGRGETADLTLF